MALLFECMGKCCCNTLDTADIVRDACLHHLPRSDALPSSRLQNRQGANLIRGRGGHASSSLLWTLPHKSDHHKADRVRIAVDRFGLCCKAVPKLATLLLFHWSTGQGDEERQAAIANRGSAVRSLVPAFTRDVPGTLFAHVASYQSHGFARRAGEGSERTANRRPESRGRRLTGRWQTATDFSVPFCGPAQPARLRATELTGACLHEPAGIPDAEWASDHHSNRHPQYQRTRPGVCPREIAEVRGFGTETW